MGGRSAATQRVLVTTRDGAVVFPILFTEIDLLQEYHTRLVADVVTGKLDHLDEEADGAELDESSVLDAQDDEA